MPHWVSFLRRQARLHVSKERYRELLSRRREPRHNERPPAHLENLEPRMMLSASLTDGQLSSRFADRFDSPISGVVKTISAPEPTTAARLQTNGALTQSLGFTAALETPSTPESIRGSGDNDLLVSYDTQGELLGRGGDDVIVVAPGSFAEGQSNVVKGGAGDDTFWVMAGEATIKGGRGYDIAFIGDAEVTLSGVEEVWVRDRETWTWSLSESSRVADNVDEATVAQLNTLSATRSVSAGFDLAAASSLSLSLASLATGPLDGDVDGSGALDAGDLDHILALLNQWYNDPVHTRVTLNGLNHSVTVNDQDPLAQTGQTFVMYSAEDINTRFTDYTFSSGQSDHFVTVTRNAGQWYYHNGASNPLTAFTPVADDLLVSELETGGQLVGKAGNYDGIELGYLDSELWTKANSYDNVSGIPGWFYIRAPSQELTRNTPGLGPATAAEDLFADGQFNQQDFNHLLHGLLSTNIGDLDLDGNVTQADFDFAVSNWGSSGGWVTGDVDGNGGTDLDDIYAILANIGWSAQNAPPINLGVADRDIVYGFDSADTISTGDGHDFIWAGGSANTVIAGEGIDTVIDPDGTDFIFNGESQDADGDGISNIAEVWGVGTDPDDADTDQDRLPDGWEYENWDRATDILNPMYSYVAATASHISTNGLIVDAGAFGDINSNGIIDGEDVDIMSSIIYANGYLIEADLFTDGVVDSKDFEFLVKGLLGTHVADSGLDLFISQASLDKVLLNWGDINEGWTNGDYNIDGFVSQADLDLVLLNWGFSSTADQVITGTDGDDIIYGYRGNDTIYGGDGEDYLWGGQGDDIIWSGAGNDEIDGGAGVDSFLDLTPNDLWFDLEGIDNDFDGVTNAVEIFELGTNPTEYGDTDSDGLPDDWETLFGFDPLIFNDISENTDGDTLDLFDEFTFGTSPNKGDSDFDGEKDGVEVNAGSDPNDASQTSGTVGFSSEVFTVRVDSNHAPTWTGSQKWSMRIGDRLFTMPDLGVQFSGSVTLQKGRSYPISIKQVDYDDRTGPDGDLLLAHGYHWSNYIGPLSNKEAFFVNQGQYDIVGSAPIDSAFFEGPDLSRGSSSRLVLLSYSVSTPQKLTVVSRHDEEFFYPIEIDVSANIDEARLNQLQMEIVGFDKNYYFDELGAEPIETGFIGRFDPRDHGFEPGKTFTIYAKATDDSVSGDTTVRLIANGEHWSGTLSDSVATPQFDANIVVGTPSRLYSSITHYFTEAEEDAVPILINSDDDNEDGIRDNSASNNENDDSIKDNDLLQITIPAMIGSLENITAPVPIFLLYADGLVELYSDSYGNELALNSDGFILIDPEKSHTFYAQSLGTGDASLTLRAIGIESEIIDVDHIEFAPVSINGPIILDPIYGADYTVSTSLEGGQWSNGSQEETNNVTWSSKSLDDGFFQYTVGNASFWYEVDLERVDYRLNDFWFPQSNLGWDLDATESSSVTVYIDEDTNSPLPKFRITQFGPYLDNQELSDLPTAYRVVDENNTVVAQGYFQFGSVEEEFIFESPRYQEETKLFVYAGFDNIDINQELDESEYIFSHELVLRPWAMELPPIFDPGIIQPIQDETAFHYAMSLVQIFENLYQNDGWYQTFDIGDFLSTIKVQAALRSQSFSWSSEAGGDPIYSPFFNTIKIPTLGTRMSTMIHELWHMYNDRNRTPVNPPAARSDEGVGYLLGGLGQNGLLNEFAARLSRFESLLEDLSMLDSRSQQRIAIRTISDQWDQIGERFMSRVLGTNGFTFDNAGNSASFTVNVGDLANFEDEAFATNIDFTALMVHYNGIIDGLEQNRYWNFELTSDRINPVLFAPGESFVEEIVDGRATFWSAMTVDLPVFATQ